MEILARVNDFVLHGLRVVLWDHGKCLLDLVALLVVTFGNFHACQAAASIWIIPVFKLVTQDHIVLAFVEVVVGSLLVETEVALGV
jgi:hypothetical protein